MYSTGLILMEDIWTVTQACGLFQTSLQPNKTIFWRLYTNIFSTPMFMYMNFRKTCKLSIKFWIPWILLLRNYLGFLNDWPKKALAGVAQLVGESSHTPKGYGFDSQSGHIPRLWVQSPDKAHSGSSQLMFPSHINVSLCLFFSLPVPLNAMKKCPQMRI